MTTPTAPGSEIPEMNTFDMLRHLATWHIEGGSLTLTKKGAQEIVAELTRLRALLGEARTWLEFDSMAVGHSPDSDPRTRAVREYRALIERIDAALKGEGT